jgi:hypothetical protein
MTEHLDTAILEHLIDETLFYPCSGKDWETPLNLFAPYITDFWFVDCNYFLDDAYLSDWEIQEFGYMRPADQQEPVLMEDGRYALLDVSIQGPPRWNPRKRHITPCILTETYHHLATGRSIRIHRRRGYGYSAIAREIDRLGVFFYRGDSQGEGGSGNTWLRSSNLERALCKLIDGGLVVSDGSDGRRYLRLTGTYKALYVHEDNHRVPQLPAQALIAKRPPFRDKDHHRLFTCIGYAGERYGPTMIWQVHWPETYEHTVLPHSSSPMESYPMHSASWSDTLKNQTRRILANNGLDAILADDHLHMKHIDSRFGSIALADLFQDRLKVVDKKTGQTYLFADIEALIADGWAID